MVDIISVEAVLFRKQSLISPGWLIRNLARGARRKTKSYVLPWPPMMVVAETGAGIILGQSEALRLYDTSSVT